MASSQQSERAKVEQIVAEFFGKSLHIILESRIPDIQARPLHGPDESATSSARGATNTWFNMELDTCAVAAEAAEPWRRSRLEEPMVVDVHVHQPQARDGSSPASPSGVSFQEAEWSEPGRGSTGTLLERWVVQYDRQDRRRRQGTAGELSLKDEAAGFGTGSGRTDGRVPFRGELLAGFSRAGSLVGARSGSQGSGSGMITKGPVEVPLVYKRAVIMLRTLYCTARTLPAYRLFRLAKNSSLSRSFTLAFRVSPFPPDMARLDESSMTPYSFTPIDTSDGRMCVSVAYRHTSAVRASQITPSITPKIISDYVGSPTTDPLRRFSSSPHKGSANNSGVLKRRGAPVVSLPTSPSGAGLGRRHSWSGAANKAPGSSLPSPIVRNNSKSPSPVHPSDFFPSPPHPPSPRPASSPLGHGMSPRSSPSHPLSALHYPSLPSSFHQTSQPIPVKGRLHSPAFTPSPSPSPPNPSLPLNPRHCSAPVSIPRTSARSPHTALPSEVTQVHSRNSLPPQSPKSKTTTEPLTRTLSSNSRPISDQAINHHSPSEGKAAARLFITSLAGSSLLASPSQPYTSDQAEVGANRLPTGQSGLVYAKTAVKAGRHVDVEDEDEELICPFAVDDDEIECYRSRLDSPEIKGKVGIAFESLGHGVGSYQRSEDAAVGALVKILKMAAPLRQSSFGFGFQSETPYSKTGSERYAEVSTRADFWGDPASGTGFGWGVQSGDPRMDMPAIIAPGAGSIIAGSQQGRVQTGSHILKTAADALEEFKAYKEMKEHLLRQSGGTSSSSQSAVQS